METTWSCWRMNSVCVASGKADLQAVGSSPFFFFSAPRGLARLVAKSPRFPELRAGGEAGDWRVGVGGILRRNPMWWDWEFGILLPSLSPQLGRRLMVMGCEVLHSPVSRPTALSKQSPGSTHSR
jgi:hypothetical protein